MSERAVHSDEYREIAFKNHGEDCVVCGSGENVIAHHVDGDRSNNDPDNLRPMCRSCHLSVHHGANDEWSPLLPERAIIDNHATELRDYELEPLDVLAEGRANPLHIREQTSLSSSEVSTVLNRLARAGLARQVTRGLYEITVHGEGELAQVDAEE
jgi:hypothetical protein